MTIKPHIPDNYIPVAEAIEVRQDNNASRVLAAISPALDPSVGIVVCIPSFRRPQHLRVTLESLARQSTDRAFAVVIVENDAVGCASVPVAAQFLQSGKIQGLCMVEPQQGNCHAINAAYETALAVFPNALNFLMIDDDEVASTNWIERMVSAAEATGADIIGGPVFSKFHNELKRDLRDHPAFRPAYDRSGPVPIIYGCGNCLIRRSVFGELAEPPFDVRFNFLGGGDVDFFVRCRQAGRRFYWEQDAAIVETVPVNRTKLGWLVTRGLRIGAINYHVQRKAARSLGARLKLAGKMLAILPISLVHSLRLAVIERHTAFAMHPVSVAAGSALAAFGIEPQPYKASSIVS